MDQATSQKKERSVFVLLLILVAVGVAASVLTVHAVVTDGYGPTPERAR